MKSAVTALALLAALALPRTGLAASLRCGDRDLVSDGARKAEVLLKCGEPFTKDSRVEEIHLHGRIIYKTIDEWTYNFGPYRLMQIVVFHNGVLVDVQSGPYGR